MPSHRHGLPLSFLPSPSISGFHLGALYIHFYGLMYIVGIVLAVIITIRRWRAVGGDPDMVWTVTIWAVPLGIVGGRIYFDITTPAVMPHHWWGPFAVWTGGLGIWGGVAGGAAAGIWRLRRAGVSAGLFANAVAPALLVAQAVGRIGNYFNQELFGKPSTLPWALEIAAAHRPTGYVSYSTFQPSFLYELIFDLAWAAALVWIGHHRRINPWGLFALYVAGYSGYRIFEETIRIDYSQIILGMRLNFWVAILMTLIGIGWFVWIQRRSWPDQLTAPARAAELMTPAAAAVSPAAEAASEQTTLRDAAAPPGAAVAPGGITPDTAAEL